MQPENIPIVNQNESEIIAGLSIAIYDIPKELQTKESLASALKSVMRSGNTQNEITDILFSSESRAGSINSQRKVVGIIRFHSTLGSREILLKVPAKGEVEGLVLRAGELSCGPHTLNIEGCTPMNSDGSFIFYTRPTLKNCQIQTVEPVRNPTRRNEYQPESSASVSNFRKNTNDVKAASSPSSFSSMKAIPTPQHSSSPPLPLHSSSGFRGGGSFREVILLEMLLLFCGDVPHGEKKTFPVHPYLVTQILRDRVVPSAISMLPVRYTEKMSRVEVNRALLEVTREGANTLQKFFNSVVVELVTPYSKNHSAPEARFRLFVKRATLNESTALLERRADLLAGPIYEPPRHIQEHLLFERSWFQDAVALAHDHQVFSSSSPSKHGRGAAVVVGGEEDIEKTKFAPRRKEEIPKKLENNNNSSNLIISPCASASTSVAQKKEGNTQPTISSSSTVTAAGGTSTTAVATPSSCNPSTTAVATPSSCNPSTTAVATPSSCNPSTTAVATPSSCNPSTTTTIPAASITAASSSDSASAPTSSFPIKYREIYSEKYQRVYYAYICPETGVEKSTWILPGCTGAS